MFSFSDQQVKEYLKEFGWQYLEEGDVPLDNVGVYGTGVEISFVNDGDVGVMVVSRDSVEEDMEKQYV